jgi:hypothetical protein
MNTCTLEAVAAISERTGSANRILEQLQRQRRQQRDSTYRLLVVLEARFAARGCALSQNPNLHGWQFDRRANLKDLKKSLGTVAPVARYVSL